ncbi:MAG: glycerate kinase [Clostridia bacterium]|nr:glycerate kinase [Clostridia bacterium]
MKIIVAPDSYKGTLSSPEAAQIIAGALREKLPLAKVLGCPIADGGEGTAECLAKAAGGGIVVTTVKNCFFEDTQVRIALIDGGKTAVVEMAQAAGLPFAEGRKNPLLTTTFGVGQMISTALSLGVKKILLCLGGSATNDLGCGAAAALGARFLDRNGEEMLPVGGTLDEVAKIDLSSMHPALCGVEMIALTDVRGTLCGESGAAKRFAPQKGADAATVELLENGAKYMLTRLLEDLGLDFTALVGGGAAGGLGVGAAAFFGAKLQSGVETVLDVLQFDRLLEGADLVITGEGRTDVQSVDGKAISGVLERAKAKDVPVFLLSGALDGDGNFGADAAFSTLRDFCTFAEVKGAAAENLRAAAENLAAAIALGYAAAN